MGLISNGTTIFNNGSFSVGGSLTLISTQTASNSASISFTTGIDSTYKEYQFYFINIDPLTTGTKFQFNFSTDSGSNYNVTKTTTSFTTYHTESGTNPFLGYEAGADLAQSTAYQVISIYDISTSTHSDNSLCGYFTVFNPSSTTYVKHFMSTCNYMNSDSSSPYMVNDNVAGYGNTTSAINAIQFKVSSGNFDGTIAMFGVK